MVVGQGSQASRFHMVPRLLGCHVRIVGCELAHASQGSRLPALPLLLLATASHGWAVLPQDVN